MSDLDNPFSPLAVARAVSFDEVSIETDAIREAYAAVRGYLETRTPSPEGLPVRSGNVLAVCGDYGTGKTHLAGWLMRHVRDATEGAVDPLYLDPASDSFLDLYRAFVTKLGLSAIQSRVNELYADIVADSMQGKGMTSDVVQWLKDGEIEPRLVVERLGLTESMLLKAVAGMLGSLTGDNDLAQALTLLLRPGFETAVWEWLMGSPPEPVLTDREITKVVGTERAALDMLGSLTLLMGGQQRHFVVVVDEFHELFLGHGRTDTEVLDGFQKLLEVFSAANAFLVLAGVPEALTVLPAGVRQRIGRVVMMSGLSVDTVCEFITLAQHRQFGVARLSPFSRDTVAYLVSLSGGRARTVIRLCHELYRIAVTGRQPVSEEMITQVVRDQLGTSSTQDVPADVRRVLDGKGLSYLRDHVLGGPESRADFWLPLGDDTGCAILVTRSLLEPDDVDRVNRRKIAIQVCRPQATVVIVVNGVVSDRVNQLVRESFDLYPLIYRPGQFIEDLNAVIDTVTTRLRRLHDENPFNAMQERIDQLNRQQTTVMSALEQVVVQSENSQAAVNRSFALLQRDIADLTAAAYGVVTSAPERGQPLPADVDRLFTEPISLLDRLIEFNGVFDGAFPQPGWDPDQAADVRDELQNLLRSRALIEANGAAAALRQAVLAFRRVVAEWYHSEEVRMSSERLTDDAEDRLDTLCRAYGSIVEFVPIDRLEPLIRRGRQPDFIARVSQSLRRADLDAALDVLHVRVRRALLKSVFVKGQ
ncbi:Cdc6-like AAA superfamily ATPase [Kibdelosporangium banguiense]|uniref:Cdc6-like AAA superfamily ATPase n=1 Tax=Kibdelosporangium banguiense TaxID=1365924 RepID=A0ABS4TPF5_9PSEU|nr:hypothetical protein [Kibdelosporangium banguiense]MBP2326284.1 Cdc6-like AAA superfamily ATPase [Kibdelosporangium banguiense]